MTQRTRRGPGDGTMRDAKVGGGKMSYAVLRDTRLPDNGHTLVAGGEKGGTVSNATNE